MSGVGCPLGTAAGAGGRGRRREGGVGAGGRSVDRRRDHAVVVGRPRREAADRRARVAAGDARLGRAGPVGGRRPVVEAVARVGRVRRHGAGERRAGLGDGAGAAGGRLGRGALEGAGVAGPRPPGGRRRGRRSPCSRPQAARRSPSSPCRSARVGTGPPLSCRTPSRGSLVVARQLLPPAGPWTLPPPFVTAPRHCWVPLSEKIVPLATTLPPAFSAAPASPGGRDAPKKTWPGAPPFAGRPTNTSPRVEPPPAALPAIVTCMSVAFPPVDRAPPSPALPPVPLWTVPPVPPGVPDAPCPPIA